MREIERVTAANWLAKGVIWEVHCGEENTYYADEFGNEFYCKNLIP